MVSVIDCETGVDGGDRAGAERDAGEEDVEAPEAAAQSREGPGEGRATASSGRDDARSCR